MSTFLSLCSQCFFGQNLLVWNKSWLKLVKCRNYDTVSFSWTGWFMLESFYHVILYTDVVSWSSLREISQIIFVHPKGNSTLVKIIWSRTGCQIYYNSYRWVLISWDLWILQQWNSNEHVQHLPFFQGCFNFYRLKPWIFIYQSGMPVSKQVGNWYNNFYQLNTSVYNVYT